MKLLITILLTFITISAYAQDWFETEAEGVHIALEYYQGDFLIHFDIEEYVEKIDQFTDIELGLVGGAILPYHFKPSEEIDMRYEALSLPLPTDAFMTMKTNGAINYLKINNVSYPLSENDRGRIIKKIKGGLK